MSVSTCDTSAIPSGTSKGWKRSVSRVGTAYEEPQTSIVGLSASARILFPCNRALATRGHTRLPFGNAHEPSRMSGGNTFRLESWWMEKRRLDERLTARVGSLQGRISMRRNTTAHRSSLSLWGMPWAISLPTMSPTIHHLPRNGGAKLFRSITSM